MALKVYTREVFPYDWARTHHNLATAYVGRIRGERLENLEQALDHGKQALEVFSRETFPEEWAGTKNSLATAYIERVRGERAETWLEQAIDYYQIVLEVFTRADFPYDWAKTQNSLARAYSSRIRGERAENLEQAIDHEMGELIERAPSAEGQPPRRFTYCGTTPISISPEFCSRVEQVWW